MLLVTKPVGRNAAAKKYDILSALSAYALSQDKHRQRQVMRLMALITTRYNWQRNELSMGQREIARLWCVDERTVKREMAKFRARNWILVKRAGARGRVCLYELDLSRIVSDTKDTWENIGPDFVERMQPGNAPGPHADNVVPFQMNAGPGPVAGGNVWQQAQAWLHSQDPATYASWFENLAEAGREGCIIRLVAPTRFHASYVSTHLSERLYSALRRSDPSISGVDVSS